MLDPFRLRVCPRIVCVLKCDNTNERAVKLIGSKITLKSSKNFIFTFLHIALGSIQIRKLIKFVL